MYDSVTWQAIPADAELVAGYLDGLYRWPNEAWQRFPNAVKVYIVINPRNDSGLVLDCEWGDATPADCPGWIRMRQASGLAIPTIYCSASVVPDVQAACTGLTFDLWVAHYTGVEHLEPGSAATQWADPDAGSGGDWDISLCQSWWPRQ